MDPKEQIRQFLEQRRELGESEFVLDSMGVDEVLRVLGAGPGRPPGPGQGSGRTAGAPTATGSAAADWRSALNAVGAGPGMTKHPEAPVAAADVRPGIGSAGPPRSQDRPIPPELRNPSVPGRIIPPPRAAPPPSEASSPAVTEPSDAAAPVPLDQLPAGLVVGSPAHELFGGQTSPWNSLGDIASAVAACTSCTLYRTAKNPVPGVGNPNADFVCVGEAPGATEDEQGVPFVGQAGLLLTKILAAINLSRDDVFICNVLKHRPPGNRNPMPDEVQACTPYLVRQIELLRPKVLLALGTFAAQTLLQTKEPIGKLRGKIHRYYGVPLVVTYHPAALLRNPSWKRPTWEDVQLARRLLDRANPGA